MEDILVLGTVGREKIQSFENVSPVVFGGTAFYATEAILRTSTSDPLLVSALGYDLTPEELIGQFSREVRKSGIQQNADLPSFYWEARYEYSFDESVTIALENRLIDGFDPNWATLRSQFPEVRFCYLAAFDPIVQLNCCEHFADTFIISETLEYWIGRDKETVLEVARRSNGVVVTEREFRNLWRLDASPYTPHERIVHIVDEFELDFLIVTFGDRGSQVFDMLGSFFVPAMSGDAIDSTGAGNAFSGGIVSHLSQGETYDRRQLVHAVALGTVLAGIQVRDFSNHALRKVSSADISALQREVENSIRWFDAEGWG